jgi:predicted transcriptional regulator
MARNQVVSLLALWLASVLSANAQDVQLTLIGKAVAPGDYKPADVVALTMQNGLLAITFAPDGSATSLIKDGKQCGN